MIELRLLERVEIDRHAHKPLVWADPLDPTVVQGRRNSGL